MVPHFRLGDHLPDALFVPIRRPEVAVIHAERIAARPACDARQFPAADERVATEPTLVANRRPLPKGNSAIQFRLNWWGVSKSETARRALGEKAFASRLPGDPTLVLEL